MTVKIKIIGVESALEKLDFFHYAILSQKSTLSEKTARNHFSRSMIIFEKKETYYDKNLYNFFFSKVTC